MFEVRLFIPTSILNISIFNKFHKFKFSLKKLKKWKISEKINLIQTKKLDSEVSKSRYVTI